MFKEDKSPKISTYPTYTVTHQNFSTKNLSSRKPQAAALDACIKSKNNKKRNINTNM